MDPLPTLAAAEKRISFFPGWSAPEPETGYIWFDAPMEIGGVTERGFILHGGCLVDKPDRHLVFEVRISKVPGRRCIPLMRFEWRSLKGGHTNPRCSGEEWSAKRVGPTHLHPFDLNWMPSLKRMRWAKLRAAVDIAEDLQTFNAVRDFVGDRFRINNLSIVKEPPWDYRLDL
jgi:hypothetical protein